MSFHEKSAWVCGGSILVVFIPYFAFVLRQPLAFVGLFALAVAGLVALLIGFHVINAISTPSIRQTGDVPPTDELDRLIELRAAKLSGIVLAVVVLIWSVVAMFGIPALGVAALAAKPAGGAGPAAADFAVPVVEALFWVHVLFAGFVVANITYYGGIVAAYRSLADG